MSKFLKSADGTEIYADAVGDPSKPAVVFVHGFSLSSFVFDALFADPQWIASVYMVRFDVRGHGRSGKPEDGASWESRRFAEDFDAVVEGFGLKRPFIAGWSLGAALAADILSVHPPTYLSGVIYLAALPYYSVMPKVGTPATLAVLPPLMQTADVGAYQAGARGFVDLCSDDFPFVFYQACLGNFMMQPRNVTLNLLTRTQDESGLLKAGKDSGLALLIVNGGLDKVTIAAEILRAVEGWKNLKVVEIENADHTLWIREPDALRREILTWIRDTLSAL